MSVEEWNRRTPPDALRDAVVAAARAWARAGEWAKSSMDLLEAVHAYEAALPPGAA